MPWLSAAFLAARPPQAASLGRLFQTIARWWLARVAAILRKLVLQCLNAGRLYHNDLQQASSPSNLNPGIQVS